MEKLPRRRGAYSPEDRLTMEKEATSFARTIPLPQHAVPGTQSLCKGSYKPPNGEITLLPNHRAPGGFGGHLQTACDCKRKFTFNPTHSRWNQL